MKCKICGCSDAEQFKPNNKSTCKSCISNKRKEEYKNSEELRLYTKTNYDSWVKKNTLQYRLLSARNRAKKKGIPCTIDLEYLKALEEKQDNKCYYSGIKFRNDDERFSVSLDRTDPKKGYIPGNIKLVCSMVNYMKSDYEVKDFYSMMYRILNRKQGGIIV